MNIDVIVSWPTNCDYPLWRRFLLTNRDRFRKVIIAWTKTQGPDNYKDFVENELKDNSVIFFDAPVPMDESQDWRDLAVREALKKSDAEWVWFTEQDFYFTDPKIWDDLPMWMNRSDVIGVYDGSRLHPCCLFIKRERLNDTRLNFGIVKDKLDHFGMIQEDLERTDVLPVIIHESRYKHYAGLSSNFWLISTKQQPNYKPEEFKKYIEECFESGVPIPASFIIACGNFMSESDGRGDPENDPKI